jgi:hypothetical protein
VFAAMLGYNPVQELLAPTGLLHTLPAANVATLTGRQFFPELISAPVHHGLTIVFTAAALMALAGAAVSWMRGKKPDGELEEPVPLFAPDDVASAVDAVTADAVDPEDVATDITGTGTVATDAVPAAE